MTDLDHDLGTRDGTSGLSGARLFPIGFGLGAIAALALFFGYRAVATPEADDATRADAVPAAGAVETPSAPATAVVATGELPAREVATDEPPADGDAYAAAAPDLAAATSESPALAGLEELASLGGDIGDDGATTSVIDGARLPSVGDPATSALFGDEIMMVSSNVPRVIVLADGTSLVPGERLPGGHRIVDIRRERILLERDGVEWRVQIP